MKKLHNHLKKLGIESPASFKVGDKSKIEHHVEQIMIELGLDLADDSLAETPRRVAKMYVDEVFGGLNYDNFPKVTCIENKMGVDQTVLVGGIDVSSTCEHHFITIDGLADVAYIPGSKVIGLSKINRIVEFFARRPQVQERLTRQVKESLCFLLETEDVAVHISAKHFCVKARGIKDAGSYTRTIDLGGVFKTDPNKQTEFYRMINK